MRNAQVLVVVLLTLGTLMAAPGFAADAIADAELALPAFAADGDLEVVLVEEELLMTPAESAELQEILDPSQGLLENKIRDCTGEDWRCPDPENCRCLAVTATQVFCDCS